LAAAVDIISMAQQLVANVSGQSELDLAQLITSSMEPDNIPPPGVSITWPGNFTGCCSADIILF